MRTTVLVSLFIRFCSVPSSILYVYFVVQFFFLLTNNFQNSEQNSLKQNENFIVSCDQLGDLPSSSYTTLDGLHDSVIDGVISSVKTSTLCGLML